ncbi:MAG TPA: EamA family transporter [Beijerinckiaceae bacterium]|nr:EamA family transporter [Beijerinckiaceae bacterium]
MDVPTTMEPHVFAAVLAAAAMHAGWNSVLKVRLEPLVSMTLITVCAAVVATPALLWFGFPRWEAWPWLIASIVLHLGYYITLTEAYRRADMGQVYPIARGGAPLLTTAATLFLLREPVGLQGGLGIAILASGVILISMRGGRARSFDPVAVAFALATAAIICGYTLVDGIGARTAGDPHAYSAALFVLDVFPLLAFAFWRRSAAELATMKSFVGPGILGGAMSVGAYWIAIWAMTVAPIALVAALRESSVLFAVLIAVFILKEPFLPIRAVAAALIIAGIALIRLQ